VITGEWRRRYTPRLWVLVWKRWLRWSCHEGRYSIHWTVSKVIVSDGRQSHGQTSCSWRRYAATVLFVKKRRTVYIGWQRLNLDIFVYASCSGRHFVRQGNVNIFAALTIRSLIWR